MKVCDRVRLVLEDGAVFVRHGHDHDWYRNVVTGRMTAIPRHREVKENTARKIIRVLATPTPDEQT
jgi:mRNA interferase HicA